MTRMQLHSPVRAALLLGAGASHFAGFPTVDSFFSHVWPNRGTRLDELCSQIARRISIYEGNSENMRWPTFDAEKVFGWLEILDKAHQIQTVDGGLGAVTISNNRGASMSANELMTELKSEIVRAYSRELTPETLTAAPHNELLKLLDTLIPETEPLHIFTTNYDGLLEQLFRHWNNGNSQIHKQFRVSNGFPLDQPRRWQANLLEEKPIPGVRLIKLAKLHGSITWKADYDGSIIDTGWARATDHDVLLYFGYKSVPESEPFFTFHQLLKSTLL